MPIRFHCDCGKSLSAPDAAAGRRGKCPACQTVFVVPTPVAPVLMIPAPADDLYGFADNLKPPERRAVPIKIPSVGVSYPTPEPLAERARKLGQPVKKVEPIPQLTGSTGRSYRYLFLLVALLPLLWSTVRPEPAVSREDQYDQTVENHPEVAEKLVKSQLDEQSSEDHSYYAKPKEKKPVDEQVAELMNFLPDHKCDGAMLAYDTYAHWGLAVLSGAAFFGLILLLFPPGHTKVWHLLVIGAFTGTAGIILLLCFQWLAFHMVLFRGGNIVTLLLDLIWLIGQSYRLALGDHGFFLSALGFIAGVGFCEEVCKVLPVVWKMRTTGFISWRSAMLWGLVSGIGFGVSEGVTYSHDFYNGFLGPQVYLVRFISCVALHGIWSAAVGINLFRRQAHFEGQMHVLEWLQQLAITAIVPMVLHGMYDTLLKEDLDWVALIVAFASFGWLAYQVELAKRRYDIPMGVLVK